MSVKDPKKILILRFSAIGDIVLTTPVIRTLKVQFPDAEVHYCTKASYRTLVESNPYLDKVHLLEGSLQTIVKTLRQEKYDFIVDLHRNLRTRLIKWQLLKPSATFPKLSFQKSLMAKLKINHLPNVHVVDRYMEAVKPLGVKPDTMGLDYFIPEQDVVARDWLPETHRGRYVVYALGGQQGTKRLPFHRMVELCDRINKPIVLVGGPEDKEVGDRLVAFFQKSEENAQFEERLASELGKRATVFNACGQLNLNQSASIIKGAAYVFAHDTGMMHVAAAFRKNIFCIWGNTIPLFGMYPYRTKFTILENNKVNCRPCSKIGYDQCPKGHFKCMEDIVFDFWLP
ncbi:MAG: glycosyltransferase family 9 protein [Bacteroidota bacterium]